MKKKQNIIAFAPWLFIFSVGCTGGINASPNVNLNQGSNGVDTLTISPMNWVNGNLGTGTAHYNEQMSTPFQCVFTGLTAGIQGIITIGYDIKHSSRNAYDYLTYYNRLLPHNFPSHNTPETIDPLSGTGLPSNTPFTTYPIPIPSAAGSPIAGQPVTSFITLSTGERLMTLYNGTIDTIYYVTQGDLNAAQSETRIAIKFTPSGPTTVLLWGGHIASRNDWGYSIGGPNSAGGISGSPFHMRLVDWTLANTGNQDRSLGGSSVGGPPPPPLPITLLNFNVNVVPQGVQLNWTTALEYNNSYFTLERSTGNLSFEPIGIVDGAGNSNTLLDYSWLDKDPGTGTNYYRLTQTDFDGASKNYGPVCIRTGETPFSLSLINIYPNPATGDFYLTYSSEDRSTTQLEVMNAEGKTFYSETLNSMRGANFIEIKNSILPGKGIYFVRLSQGQVKSQAERIVKN